MNYNRTTVQSIYIYIYVHINIQYMSITSMLISIDCTIVLLCILKTTVIYINLPITHSHIHADIKQPKVFPELLWISFVLPFSSLKMYFLPQAQKLKSNSSADGVLCVVSNPPPTQSPSKCHLRHYLNTAFKSHKRCCQ